MTELDKPKQSSSETSEHQKTYQIFDVMEDGRIHIQTTDRETLKELFEELRSHIPTAKVDTFFGEFPKKGEGGIYAEIHNLAGKDLTVAWWLMRRLGEKSWEPFAVYPYVSGGETSTSSKIHYCFRKSTFLQNFQKPEGNKG